MRILERVPEIGEKFLSVRTEVAAGGSQLHTARCAVEKPDRQLIFEITD
ncbi:MAG TPA: hypothetical protein VGD13_06835 [Xanthobacteraceae bacterium]